MSFQYFEPPTPYLDMIPGQMECSVDLHIPSPETLLIVDDRDFVRLRERTYEDLKVMDLT